MSSSVSPSYIYGMLSRGNDSSLCFTAMSFLKSPKSLKILFLEGRENTQNSHVLMKWHRKLKKKEKKRSYKQEMVKTEPKACTLVKALHPKQFKSSTHSFIQSVCVQIALKLITPSLDQPRKETSMQLSNLTNPHRVAQHCKTVAVTALL